MIGKSRSAHPPADGKAVYVEALCSSLSVFGAGVVIPAMESVARLGRAERRSKASERALISARIDFTVATTDCAAVFTTMLQCQASEVFAILCLSTKQRVLAYHEVSHGCLDSTLVHPREVFKGTPRERRNDRARAQPSERRYATPSPDDMVLTRRLVDAGRLLGVDVLDHIVIGDGRYLSFRERGWL
jgi:DNA repair protein RadC